MADRILYKRLADFGREILEKRTLLEGLPLIARYAKELIGAERASIFIHDPKAKKLWTMLADNVEKIVIDDDKGVVGETLQKQKPLIVNDVNKDPNFYPEVDRSTGYRTYNLITAPIYDMSNGVCGVLELLNKEGGFTKEDIRFIKLFAHALSSFAELMQLENK